MEVLWVHEEMLKTGIRTEDSLRINCSAGSLGNEMRKPRSILDPESRLTGGAEASRCVFNIHGPRVRKFSSQRHWNAAVT